MAAVVEVLVRLVLNKLAEVKGGRETSKDYNMKLSSLNGMH